jgi:hypothetical protein
LNLTLTGRLWPGVARYHRIKINDSYRPKSDIHSFTVNVGWNSMSCYSTQS